MCRKLAGTLFGETEELMVAKVCEFRVALEREGINVPDYDHFNRKFLRAGGLDVEASVNVLKNYLRAFSAAPKYFECILPHSKTRQAFESQVETVLPQRYSLCILQITAYTVNAMIKASEASHRYRGEGSGGLGQILL